MKIIDSKTVRMGKRSAIVILALMGDVYEVQAVTNSGVETLWQSDDASPECYRGIRRVFRNL